MAAQENSDTKPTGSDRRGFFRRIGSWFMGLGLLSGYGFFAALIGRFLLPTRSIPRGWMYVASLDGVAVGGSVSYLSPVGQKVLVTRVSNTGNVDDFIALSSVCPHLGCQVHWEPENNRFFCPCHNGVFNAAGKATQGPPADAGQSLARYPLKIEDGLLFIEVETRPLIRGDASEGA